MLEPGQSSRDYGIVDADYVQAYQGEGGLPINGRTDNHYHVADMSTVSIYEKTYGSDKGQTLVLSASGEGIARLSNWLGFTHSDYGWQPGRR